MGQFSPDNRVLFRQPSLKHSTSFRIIPSNQKLARALTNAPKAIAPTNSSCCLATSGTNTRGSARSRKPRMSPSTGVCSPDCSLPYLLLTVFLFIDVCSSLPGCDSDPETSICGPFRRVSLLSIIIIMYLYCAGLMKI